MRNSPFVNVKVNAFVFLTAGLLLNGALLVIPACGQSYGDVTVRKNPDGSIETFDSSQSAPAPRRSSGSGYKRGTQKYSDGVVVRKNADGSIETFDTGGVAPPRSGARGTARSTAPKAVRSSSGKPFQSVQPAASSSGVHKFVHKFPKGTKVKTNPDGTIEVIGFTGGPAGSKASEKSPPAKAGAKASSTSRSNSAKSSSSTKVGTAAKAKRRTARRPRGHGNFGDVRVIRNPDGSIETYDAN